MSANHYIGDPLASADAFQDGWFYSGDLGFVDDHGRIHLTGRSSERINASGKKINPTALELFAIANAPINDAAAFSFVDDAGVERLALAVVSDAVPDIGQLHLTLSKEFGHLVPAQYVRVAEVPRNESGKILRKVLAELFVV